MSHPVPAPRTIHGRQVAKTALETVLPKPSSSDWSEDSLGNMDHQLPQMLSTSNRGEDFNLTDLISSVERDIWLLEQLENNSTMRRRNPQELPFPVTEELLKLPGYRPRKLSNNNENQEEHSNKPELLMDIKSSKNVLADLPPALPPKMHKSRRQRRHSDSITCLTESTDQTEEEPKLFDEALIHQRLLPRSNCVTNILYARRLPSPPVIRRVPPEPSSPYNFAQDDTFCEKDIEQDKQVRKLYCPLCTQTFGYSFGLECHLLSAHQNDLQTVKALGGKWSCACLWCHAQFLKQEVLLQHFTAMHKDLVMKKLLVNQGEYSDSEYFNTDTLKSKKKNSSNKKTGSLGRYVECKFCGQNFLRRHQNLFVIHVEQKHLLDLDSVLLSDKNSNRQHHPENIEIGLVHSLANKVRFTSPTSVSTGKEEKRSLRSSLRRRRSNSAPRANNNNNNNNSRAYNPDNPPDILNQSLDDDHQFVSQDNSPVHEAGKRSLRFSIPEVAHHHYYEVVDDVANKDDFDGKRERSSEEELSANSQVVVPALKQVKKKLKRSETNVVPVKLPVYHRPHKSSLPETIQATPHKSKERQRFHSEGARTYRHIPQPEPPPHHLGSSEDERHTYSSMSDDNASVFSYGNSLGRWTLRETSNSMPKLYKCNLCEIAFAENAFLLTHLKNKHRSAMSIKVLRPQFSCGACPAKFFKNSFLVKHCECHVNNNQDSHKIR